MSTFLRPPVYQRQRLLLTFLKELDGPITATDLQKLVFLYMEEEKLGHYEFVPYRFGCYSFQLAQDIDTLDHYGWIKHQKYNIQLGASDPIESKHQLSVKNFLNRYQTLRGRQLIKQVYQRYPYYAIYSRITASLLDTQDIARVDAERRAPQETEPTLFTIGYEGISLENYVNKLIRNNIHVLCDVRNNPLSRKFGFSKNMLRSVLPKFGIDYIHLPELGIVAEKRQMLANVSDYQKLFTDYGTQLPQKADQTSALFALVQEKKRIALTCFEHDPKQCHRHVLSDYLNKLHRIEVVDL